MTHTEIGSAYRVWHPWTSMTHLTRESSLHLGIERSAGSFLHGSDGTKYLDGSAGMWNTSLGHGREDIIRAIADQLSRLTYLCNIGIRSPVANLLADRLLAHAPPPLNRVMLHCTGTAAVEGAVLLVRQYFKMMGHPDRVGVISVDGSYHGCSLLAAAISGDSEEARWLSPLPGECYHIPAPVGEAEAEASLQSLRRLFEARDPATISAFVFEPIMGVAGVIIPPPWWTRSVIDACRQNGIKVIADEVTTGMGRVGEWFASASEPVDAMVLGKGISGGYIPLAASLYSEELFEPFQRSTDAVGFMYGSTMDGYPAACAAGIAVLEVMERDGLVERSRTMGSALMAQLRELERLDVVGTIRGRGLMIGIPLVEPGTEGEPMRPLLVAKVVNRLMAAGLLLHPTGSVLALLPPLTISEAEVAELVGTLRDVLTRFNDKIAARKAYQ